MTKSHKKRKTRGEDSGRAEAIFPARRSDSGKTETGSQARVVHDIIQHEDADGRIRLADAIFEAASEGIMLLDPGYRILGVNPAFTRITGHRADEVVGKRPDFLASGRHDPRFLARVRRLLRQRGRWEGEVWSRRKNGEVYPEWMTVLAVPGTGNEVLYYLAMSNDILRRQRDEERINYHASYDGLTGLPNRRLIRERVEEALVRAAHSETRVGVMFIDLDRFHSIYERIGHGAGDAVLLELARNMKTVLRTGDALGRLGGETFLLVLPLVESDDEITMIAQRLQEAVSQPVQVKGRTDRLEVTVSVGIAVYPDDGETVGGLLENADAAAYYSKQAGPGTYRFFTEDMDARALVRLNREKRLARALERDELVLHYQPKVDLRTGRISGAEALVRWQSPEDGLVQPGRFIPLAEETGLIVPLGEWVLHAACARAAAWQAAGLGDLTIAVNLSARQLSKDGLHDDVIRILEETGLRPDLLELEITESSLMEHADDAIATLTRLRRMGIKLTADDFGTGYSSLHYLRTFPLDGIKIDQAFVSDIGTAANGGELAAAVVAIGQSLQKRVVAEGVENADQLRFLRQQWCDEIQGFLFSPPLPAAEFEDLVRSGRRL